MGLLGKKPPSRKEELQPGHREGNLPVPHHAIALENQSNQNDPASSSGAVLRRGTLIREPLADVRKIAVVRANRIGDFIFILPALEVLRATYPEATLVLLGLRWHADFLNQRPSPIDRIIVIPPYKRVSVDPEDPADEAVHDDFFLTMQQEHFDLACQLHGGGRFSNPFVKHLWTVWLRRSPGRELFETASLLKQALTKRSVRKGMAEALRGLPWVLKERKPPGSQ